MTDQQIEDAKNVAKGQIQVYVNNPDPTKSLPAIQLLISTMIGNAGSLENLLMIKAALDAKFGTTP